MIETQADFIFFSIMGFLAELIYCSLNNRKSGKALRGPWCPLYGIGGLLILFIVSNLPKNIILIYIIGTIASSITEYLASYILEKIFKTRWWDYKTKKHNINGRICLENSLLFGLLTIIIYYIFNPLKEIFIHKINKTLYKVVVLLLSLIMLIDALTTIFEAIELKSKIDLIIKIGTKNKDKLKQKLKKHKKSTHSPKRLLSSFDFTNDEKTNILKKFYKIKTKKHNKNKFKTLHR